MKRLRPTQTIPLIMLVSLALCAILLYLAFRTPAPIAVNPLSTQVYVWQRNWTDSVREAVRNQGPAFNRVVILMRQISWENGQPHAFRVAVDWPALKATTTPVGAAIRMDPYAGPMDRAGGEFLAQTLRNVREEARQNRVPLAEIQLDFDCSTARLKAYRGWLQAIKPAAGEIPLAITTLPAWLDSADFAPLVETAGAYVLQVHGLEKPQTISDPLVLCDPAAARRAIAKAGRMGVPFRVALPTYSYAVGFDGTGQFVGMVAEGAPADWEQGKTVRLAGAQPTELAALVRELSAAHPPAMEGIIWYRMPVATDRRNWRWVTLSAVMKGRDPGAAE